MLKLLRRYLALVLFISVSAIAQPVFPNKPVRIIVPWPPGGLSDSATRLIGLKLSEEWKQPVVIENRAGANGIIGTDAAVKAKPDGYSIVNSNTDTDTLNKLLYASIPYDAERDLTAVGNMVTQPMVLVASATFGPSTMQEVLAEARSKPGEIAYASWGRGSVSHLAMELLTKAANVRLVHVPYKGVAPAVSDVMSGHVPLMFVGSATAVAQAHSGKVKLLAIAAKERLPQLSSVPTIAELGFDGVTAESWNGLSVPAGTDSLVVQKISSSLIKVLNSPEVRERINAQGAKVVISTPTEHARYIRENTEKWRGIVNSLGIKPE